MLHYHGTPITPRAALATMPGRHFCVSHAAPNDLAWCIANGASVMLDNGAFSAWTKGRAVDWGAFYEWAAPHARHPHWAVIPDVIDGDEDDNDALLAACPLPRETAAPVWHLHESLDRLARLAGEWPRVCFGSSGAFASPGASSWRARIDAAWDVLERQSSRPWVHMLRAMKEASEGPWPFASADSTNIARNHNGASGRPAQTPELMAIRIDRKNPRYLGKRAEKQAVRNSARHARGDHRHPKRAAPQPVIDREVQQFGQQERDGRGGRQRGR